MMTLWVMWGHLWAAKPNKYGHNRGSIRTFHTGETTMALAPYTNVLPDEAFTVDTPQSVARNPH